MSTTAPTEPAPAAEQSIPTVHQAIALAMRDTSPVGKDQINQGQRYRFRGIDDVMSAVAGPFRAHGVFIVPEVADRTAEQRGKMLNVTVTVRYRLYGPAGDHVEAVVVGEASDTADKATNKAMSAAFKYLLFQVLMIPVDARSIDDGDRHHPANPEPEQVEQQPRHSRRAEPGPWEQAPAPPDFRQMAEDAPDVDAVRVIYTQAKRRGAGHDLLAAIAEIGSSKPGATARPTPSVAETAAEPADVVHHVQRAEDEHAAALDELYDAAKGAGLGQSEAVEVFVARFQCQPAAATVAQLREMRDDLLDAAKGGAA
ncbi:ERF family protein [Streptomyces cacaoi]|uniref:ERF family protein n=1 Tax=Streptomyces cacaoi TaxID=1898 RepID=UPI003747CFA6